MSNSEVRTFTWTGPGSLDVAAMRAAIAEDGAFLVKNLLKPAEIAELRGLVKDRLTQDGRRLSLGKTQPNAAIEDPELSWAVAHPNIVEVFKDLLDKPLFTGHCDIHMNMLSGWHKDSGEIYGGYFSGDYFNAPDCQVYKAAIYLQKAGERDGLTVRPGSHLKKDHSGEDVRVKNDIGDVVFFDVRISHTGQLPDLVENSIKAAGKLATRGSRMAQEPTWIYGAKETYWKLIGRRDRLSVFFTYGAPNRFTQEFAEANMDRQAKQTGAEHRDYPPGLIEQLGKSGVSAIPLS